MESRRRRTDLLPLLADRRVMPIEQGERLCELVSLIGFESAVVVDVPDDGSTAVACAAAGEQAPVLELATGLARRAAHDGRALRLLRDPLADLRHAAIPVGRSGTGTGTLVLVVADSRMTQREAQAIATWAAPLDIDGLRVNGGEAGTRMHALARRFHADLVALALFAPSGIMVQLHVRSGALLHAGRLPADTVWGEVARHQAAFTLGDLSMHPGTELLASLGMRTAGMVGLENGHGIAVGAFGVASHGDMTLDIAHDLLAVAVDLGPELMAILSSTEVPVPDEDGSVDLAVLAARVGCQRFAMYERSGDSLRLVAAHAADGSRLMAPPDEMEQQLVGWAAQKRIGVVSHTAAAVLIGEDTVLYAQDPDKRALECLRMALHDVQRNPFGAVDSDAA